MADVTAILDAWEKNTAASVEKYKRSINALTESPTAKAAAAADLYVQRVQEAVASGKFQAALNAVSLQDYQTACVDKGAARIAGGVKAARPKFNAFLQQLLPVTDQIKRDVRRMPKTNEAEADARLMFAVNRMRQFRFNKRK